MSEFPNFENEVLRKLDALHEDVTNIKVDVAKNYITRREVATAQKDAVLARRWSIATAIPFLLMAIDIYLIS